jgi:hypothetical protein
MKMSNDKVMQWELRQDHHLQNTISYLIQKESTELPILDHNRTYFTTDTMLNMQISDKKWGEWISQVLEPKNNRELCLVNSTQWLNLDHFYNYVQIDCLIIVANDIKLSNDEYNL